MDDTRAGRSRRPGALAVAVTLVAGIVAALAVPVSAGAALVPPGAPTIIAAGAGPAPGAVVLRWKPPKLVNTTAITGFAFDMSTDGGTTWSAPFTFPFGITSVAVSTLFPSMTCTNIAPGSKGCEYRVYALNSVGMSSPSTPVALWIAPNAPAALHATADATKSMVTLAWPASQVTGGLQVAYTIESSMDGAAFEAVASTSGTGGIAPCSAATTCAYRVRATNSQGSSAPGPTVKIDTTPGPVAAPTAFVTSVNLVTGLSQLQLGWSRPVTGTPAVSYDIEGCNVPTGKTAGCEPTSTRWSIPASIPVPATDPLRLHRTCPPGIATCMYRVRGHNSHGGAGIWHTFSTEPWAPFSVAVTPGRTSGMVKVTFRGPAESGAGSNAAKRYVVYKCPSGCSTAAGWHNSGLTVLYPLAGTGPFVAGSFPCHAVFTCEVRMRFVDGVGHGGPMTAIARGAPHR